MILSPQRKLAVVLLLIACAPFYILVRYFYGGTFLRLIGLALVLQLLGIPFLRGFLDGEPFLSAYGHHFNEEFGWALFTLAIFVAPIHLVWMVFSGYVQDGRHDPDDPGHPLIPFVHPWLIDIPAAIALPFVVAYLASRHISIPVSLPAWVGFSLSDILVPIGWWQTSIIVSVAYIAIALLTTEPPHLRLRRWFRFRNKARRIPFDAVHLALNPLRGRAGRADILMQRPEQLRRLAEGNLVHPDQEGRAG